MQDDLLEFVSGPPGYSLAWLWLGLALFVVVIGWYVMVLVMTMPSDRLRRIPGVDDMHGRLLRHRFAKTVKSITERHRTGELSAERASAELSCTLRSFLHQATGARAQYMQLRAIAASDLAPAAPILEALGSAQFDRGSTSDVGRLGDETEALIRSWS